MCYKEELNTRGDSDFAYENEHAALKAELREQRFLIQKVSDKMELSESVSNVATHNP